MAFQRIRIKNTNVSGNIPGADKLDVAELCINLKDQKLYSKDADGNVFELGGKVDSGITPPPGPGNSIGDLFWDGDFLLVWNGNEWVPVGAANLDYTPAPDKGTITNTAGDDVDLPLADDTNAGLMSPDEHKKLGDMPAIISGNTFPGTPELGDIWIDTNLCPPSINIWNDCEDPGNPDWTPIGGGEPTGCQQGGVAIAGDTEIGSTLTATGGRGLDAGELLPEPTYNWTGPNGFTATSEEIVANEEGNYTVTATITCLDGSELSTSATKTISDSYVDMVNNTPPIIAVLGELPDGAYEGNSIYVVTPATVINGENPVIVENQWFKDDAADGTGQLYVIGAGDEGKAITCKQLFRDARTNELLSEASNAITIVARPADAITFTSVITDDGTPNANTPGHVLTASAENIVGGVAPIEYEYKWLVEGLTMGANKTLNIISTFVGKIVSCEVTVAEPDGTNPEVRTAVYSKVIEIAGTINTPSVLGPQDGAGSGDMRYLLSDTIIDVEGGGIDRCETELIESVDSSNTLQTTTIGPNQNGDSSAYPTDLFNTRHIAAYNALADDDDIQAVGNLQATGGPGTNVSHMLISPGIPVFPTDEIKGNFMTYGNATDIIFNEAYVVAVGQTGSPTSFGRRKDQQYNCDMTEFFAAGETEITSITVTGGTGSAPAGILTVIINGQLAGIRDVTNLTFPSSNGFDCFDAGGVAQDGKVKISTIEFTEYSSCHWIKFDGEYLIGNYSGNVTNSAGGIIDHVVGRGPENMFDGDSSTMCQNSSKTGIKIDLSSFDLKARVVTFQGATGGQNGAVKINGVELQSGTFDYTDTEFVVGTDVVKVISKDEDANTITVDGGEWLEPADYVGQNRDQVWSNGTSVGGFQGDKTIDKAFDGDSSTYAQRTNGAGTTVYTFATPIPVTGTVTFKAMAEDVNNEVYLTGPNGNSTAITSTGSDGVAVSGDVASEIGNAINSVTFINGGGAVTRLYEITVDNLLLVDAGTGGDTKLVKETPYDTKLTVDGPTDLADMTGSTVMTDGTGAPGPFTQTPYKLVTSDIESVGTPPSIEWSADSNYNPVPGDTGSNLFNGGDLAANAAFDFVWTAPADLYASKVAVDFNEEPDGISYIGTITTNLNTYLAHNGTKEDYSSAGPGFSGIRYAFNLSEGEKLVSVGVSSGSTRYISKIFLNDQELVDNVPYPDGLILTFADPNPDLQYFKPGDQIPASSVGLTWSSGTVTYDTLNPSSVAGRDWAFTFNDIEYQQYKGIGFNVADSNSSGGLGNSTLMFDQGVMNISAGSTINYVLSVYAGGPGSACNIKLLDANKNVLLETGSRALTGTSGLRVDESVVATEDIEVHGILFELNHLGSANESCWLCSMSIDGVLVTDSVYEGLGYVNVISTGYPDSNTMVVDGGEWGGSGWDQSAEWLALSTFTNLSDPGSLTGLGLYDGVAEGDPGQTAENYIRLTASGTAVLTHTFTNVTEFAISASSSKTECTIQFDDGAEQTFVPAADTGFPRIEIANPPSSWNKLTINSNNSTTYVSKIWVNGLALVDPSIPETSSTKVEYQTNGGQGTIVSVNTDDKTLLIKDLDSNTRDNRWIAENKAGTDFYVAGPDVVDEPLLTADVELKSTDFATTPENADTLKNIVWELNGAEQNAGVSNPYKPTGLALNTEYTVRVKHQGNDLDDSEWSTATTFTTGATRNLYTYYKERVELLEARIAGIEADEIVDDATDVTLLTAFANLAQRVEALEEGGA